MHIELLSAQAVAGAGTVYSDSIYTEVGDFCAALVCASVSGSAPTIDVDIQDSPSGRNVSDDDAAWFTTLSFTQVTATGNALKTFMGPHFSRMRVKVVTTGSDTAGTVSVSYTGAAEHSQDRTNR